MSKKHQVQPSSKRGGEGPALPAFLQHLQSLGLLTPTEVESLEKLAASSPQPLLPCGHYPHRPEDEQRWTSPVFKAETQRQRELFQRLIEKLKRKGKLDPGPYPPYPSTYETGRIYEVKQHFALLKRRLSRSAYLEQVARYEQALRDFLTLPPCRRENRAIPLLPSRILGLLQPADLPTPRTGVRRPSKAIRNRNARIAELKQTGTNYRVICEFLDEDKFPVPPSWRRKDYQTWKQACKNIPGLVQALFSKITTKRS